MLGIKKQLRVLGVMRRQLQYGYAEPHETTYNVLYEQTTLFGIVIHSKEIDRETIPFNTIICQGCFGDTGGFISKFAPFDKNGYKIK